MLKSLLQLMRRLYGSPLLQDSGIGGGYQLLSAHSLCDHVVVGDLLDRG